MAFLIITRPLGRSEEEGLSIIIAMPRQKFCSVPGCLSTTEVIKKEQETFLADFCKKCDAGRPCRCPAPDSKSARYLMYVHQCIFFHYCACSLHDP